MSCLINSYGKISNLHDLINYLKVYVDDETGKKSIIKFKHLSLIY